MCNKLDFTRSIVNEDIIKFMDEYNSISFKNVIDNFSKNFIKLSKKTKIFK